MNSLNEIIKYNYFISSVYDKLKKFYFKYLISDKVLLKRRFKKRVNRELNLENPIKYNDKLQWLKLNWYDPKASKCADKYEVRNIVKNEVGSKYLNELIEVYDSVEEIDLRKLPNKFVLKGTQGSGFNIICENKSAMDWDKEFKKMKRWLNTNYYWRNREWVYKDIKPRILCERFLETDVGDELKDYRLFCFNGEPKFITVDFNINDKEKTRRNLYDLEWNLLDAEITYPKETNIKVEKPEKLEEMIFLSRKLSKNFPHARIDFYYIDNKIIFGEITFFHQSGMGTITPEAFEIKMGDWLKLPETREK